jgi:hypothetical protein
MGKQTNIFNFFQKRPVSDASDNDPVPKRAKPDPSVATEKASSTASLTTAERSLPNTTLVIGGPDEPAPDAKSVATVESTIQGTAKQEEKDEAAVATPTILRSAFQPFKQKFTWICPYKASGRYHQKGNFPTFAGVAAHVRMSHRNATLVTPYEIDPLPDGTLKIPCPNGCLKLFISHQTENQHAKLAECKAPARSNMSCSWAPYTGCTHKGFPTAKSLTNHTRIHVKDPRCPYQFG